MRTLLINLSLFYCVLFHANVPVLVKDINQTPLGSNPDNFIQVGNITYFTASSKEHGKELWKIEGASGSPSLVKDINPGPADAYPQNMVNLNGVLFFSANDGVNGEELWKSDGTSLNTIMIKDIKPNETQGSKPLSITVFNNFVYFVANDNVHGLELWKSDGTESGTSLIKDIVAGGNGSFNSQFNIPLFVFNGFLYFSAEVAPSDYSLFKSDGTESGTMVIASNFSYVRISDFYAFSSFPNLFFFNSRNALWKSDGTTNGTSLISGTIVYDIQPLTAVNGTIYFAAKESTSGSNCLWKIDGNSVFRVKKNFEVEEMIAYNGELFLSATFGGLTEFWKSDGTESGTAIVKDINVITSSTGSNPYNFTVFNGLLYFAATDTIWGNELYRSDGTESGTIMVKDIYPDVFIGSDPNDLIVANGSLYFTASDGVNGKELWKSDGSSSGTFLVKDIHPGISSSNPNGFFEFNNALFFSANTTNTNSIAYELWKSDGTSNGTTIVNPIIGEGRTENSNITEIIHANGVIYFVENSNLWKSDGTEPGTFLIKENTSSLIRNSGKLTAIGSNVFYVSSDDTNGIELWVSDGNSTGTRMVKSIYTGSLSSNPNSLTEMNGKLYFSASDNANGRRELWVSDGTSVGTYMVKNINGNIGSNPDFLTEITNLLFFRAGTSANGQELWASDGTENGTRMVKDIYPGSQNGLSTAPFGWGNQVFMSVNNLLFFTANDGTNGHELWISDGTENGTRMVKNIHASGPSYPDKLTNVGGLCFFVADDGFNGRELWVSDGTESGTHLVKDIHSSLSSDPHKLINIEGTLFFFARTEDEIFLWRSDGTETGTIPVRKLANYSTALTTQYELVAAKGKLFFAHDSEIGGKELWESDGSLAGTKMVYDIFPGSFSSLPSLLTNLNDTLYFAADDGKVGKELWRYAPVVSDIVVSTGLISPSVYCAGGNITIPYTVTTGTVAPENTFVAQISDAQGNFNNPVSLGSLASFSLSGSISGVIPENTITGANYRIRVSSSAPISSGPDNGIDITINEAPLLYVSENKNVCRGSSATLTASSNAVSYTWSPASTLNTNTGASVIANPSFSTSYAVNAMGSNGCSISKSVTLSVVDCTNLEELEKASSIALFPNPNNGSFVLNTNNLKLPFDISIINVLGEVVYKSILLEKINEIKTNLPSGIYLLQAGNNTGKLVIE